jgi:hypothetical protein
MEVNHHSGVCPDTFHRLAVSVGATSSALEQIGQPSTYSRLSTAHDVFYMTQGSALCMGEASEVRIV